MNSYFETIVKKTKSTIGNSYGGVKETAVFAGKYVIQNLSSITKAFLSTTKNFVSKNIYTIYFIALSILVYKYAPISFLSGIGYFAYKRKVTQLKEDLKENKNTVLNNEDLVLMIAGAVSACFIGFIGFLFSFLAGKTFAGVSYKCYYKHYLGPKQNRNLQTAD